MDQFYNNKIFHLGFSEEFKMFYPSNFVIFLFCNTHGLKQAAKM